MNIIQACIPPSFLFLSAIMFGVILHTPSQSHRLVLAPTFLLLSYLALAGPDHFYFSFSLMSIWNLATGLYVAHVISFFYVEKWPAPIPRPGLSLWELWMWRLATTYRYWGNPRVFVPGLASRSQQPSLASFVLWRVSKLLFYFGMHALVVPTINKLLIGDIAPSDVDADQRRLLRPLLHALLSGDGVLSAPQLKGRAVLLRAHTAVFWIWGSVIFLDGANAALSLFFVCVARVDSVSDWPPLFGSVASATSVTTFWSRFWHQLATRPYVNIGRWITQAVLRRDKSKALAKLFVAAIVFALSGCNHALVTWRAGLRDWDLEIRWFLLNFSACTFERTTTLCLQTAAIQSGVLDGWQKHSAVIVASRIWLFLFFSWSVPKWQFPRMEMQAIATKEVEELRSILLEFTK